MNVSATVRGVVAAIVVMCGIATHPAAAEIEKLMLACDEGVCPFYRASIKIPDGWVEDKEATNFLTAVMLLRKGEDFDKAEAKIYAVARPNPEKKPATAFIPEAHKQWRDAAPDTKITPLPPISRGDKGAFERHQFEAASFKQQGHELQAVTTDTDKDGNQYIVTIVLSANSPAALKAAESAYLAILSNY